MTSERAPRAELRERKWEWERGRKRGECIHKVRVAKPKMPNRCRCWWTRCGRRRTRWGDAHAVYIPVWCRCGAMLKPRKYSSIGFIGGGDDSVLVYMWMCVCVQTRNNLKGRQWWFCWGKRPQSYFNVARNKKHVSVWVEEESGNNRIMTITLRR